MSNFKMIIKQSPSEERILRQRGYKLSHKLGEGGYSEVYMSEFTGGNRVIKLACKVITTLNAPKKFREKFLPRELKVLSKVNHPHIIQIHSIFQRKMKYYIFMRHAEQGDLLDYIINNGAVQQAQARIWTRQMALAIQYLHILEIAHRDIKCENILITVHNNVKVSDFGFARSVIDEDNHRVLSQTYCGSLSYAPPQVLLGEPYNPKAADMWSFGCLIYTMLNKSNPFESKNTKTLVENQKSKNYEFRQKYARICSPEVITLVSKCLEPKEMIRCKIDQLIDSPWISMDPKLKTLNTHEYQALANAMEEAKRIGLATEPYEGHDENLIGTTSRRMNSVLVLKEYDEAFDLQLISSMVNKVEGRLSA